MVGMNRRHAIIHMAALAALASAVVAGVPRPYRASLVAGGKINGRWLAGILVELEPGWKTYWRVPGDAGIPPQFDWSGSINMQAIDVEFPIPTRLSDASGEAIGYHDKVLFPLVVTPLKTDQDVQLKLKMFFAICKVVCIPADALLEASLTASASSALITSWQQRVPVVAATPVVLGARIEQRERKPMLVLDLSGTFEDVFIESDTDIYFGHPRFDIMPGEAWLPIANSKDVAALKNLSLKVTLSAGNTGIEQSITVN